MRILYVSQYFPPEMGAPSARVHELSRHWVRHGHDVTILTGFPNHPTGALDPRYQKVFRHLCMSELVDGIDVRRTWLLPRPNRKSMERILNYTSFWASASLRGMFLRKPDVIIGTSPQLLCALAAWWISRRYRVPFVFEVRDLWPESLVAVGAGMERSMMFRTLRRIAGFLYRHADSVVVVTPAFKAELIRNWRLPEAKISVVENGVETELFEQPPTNQVRRDFGLEGRFIVCYVGTLGWAHGLQTILDAAGRARVEMPELTFLLVGAGAEREQLQRTAEARGLSNVVFVDQQPRHRVAAYIYASDAAVVLLKRAEVFRTVLPTKLLEFMACGRPIILGVEGQAQAIVEEARAGICIEPENATALLAAAQRIRASAHFALSCGRNGQEYIRNRYSRASTAERYESLLCGLARAPRVLHSVSATD